ncbi:hypothetical protein BGX29_010323 [Mortierella sp. GBA35]|nr:hypothetical protein BGX29_010323 [Mortierella sp. GBA35]
MSSEPAAAVNAQDARDQDQEPDVSMSSVTSSRPESQDTISHQQPPQAQIQPQEGGARQGDEEEEDEDRLLKREEQDGKDELKQDTEAQDEHNDVEEEGGSEMEGVVHEGVDEHSDQEDRQRATSTTSSIKSKSTKAKTTSKSKKSGTNANNQGEDDEDGEDGEEEDVERKPVTKTEDVDDDELSLSSDDDDGDDDGEDEEGGPGSGHQPNDDEYSNLPEETLCRWKDCGKVLPSLAALVIHLSDEHIGWKKTAYTCEWQGCARRPIAQTTRFALISHMRSHTKHKPYDCPVPECDKSFSRSDAMAKHLKFQHGDVPERFTGRKSRGRYTMKDPAASSTLIHSSSFGAKKRRHPDSYRSETDLPHSSSSKHRPTKLRKLGGGGAKEYDEEGYYNGDQYQQSEHRHYHHRSHSDMMILQHLENARRGSGVPSGRRHGRKDRGSSATHDDDDDGAGGEENGGRERHQNEGDDEDSDADDSDFETDNGQTPRQRYGVLKAKYEYIHNEREALEAEYEDHKKKLMRLRVERELLLDALLTSQPELQDPALQAIEDSE